MTAHRFHPEEGEPEDAILFDDGDRCTEHAHALSTLDARNSRRLMDRVVTVEHGGGRYRTYAEAEAGRRLLHAGSRVPLRFSRSRTPIPNARRAIVLSCGLNQQAAGLRLTML